MVGSFLCWKMKLLRFEMLRQYLLEEGLQDLLLLLMFCVLDDLLYKPFSPWLMAVAVVVAVMVVAGLYMVEHVGWPFC